MKNIYNMFVIGSHLDSVSKNNLKKFLADLLKQEYVSHLNLYI